ncbi:hypothetical protein [Eubacterium oxidoreducens]|uniref:hypothetical protein n=1 Tax=Eubacterium oxidoreducens TaxID=1732 RepID=UPI0015A48124|nr:hypothetical protein [Eubacterium oxidoreducens]
MNAAITNTSLNPSTNTTTPTSAPKTSEGHEQVSAPEEIKEKEVELENVVSVSEDGDTVQVSPEGNEKLDVKVIHSETEIEDEPVQKTDTSVEDFQVTSYAGMSNQQLEQLYLQGKISRADYESEIEAREERIESLQNTNSQAIEKMTGYQAVSEEATRVGDAIKEAYEDTASDTIDAQIRMQAVQNYNTQ